MAKIDFPKPIRNLIDELKRLPGIGSRSAERMAVWLLQNKKSDPSALISSMALAVEETVTCPICGFFATADICEICDDPRRDEKILCVVEHATDVLPLERAGIFSGRYHCLGGKLSPLDRISPEDLRIPQLISRIKCEDGPEEVILALGADVEGEATANYLADMFRDQKIIISRIAQGLPAGGGLEHADELTLMRALQGRRSI